MRRLLRTMTELGAIFGRSAEFFKQRKIYKSMKQIILKSGIKIKVSNEEATSLYKRTLEGANQFQTLTDSNDEFVFMVNMLEIEAIVDIINIM